MRRGWEFHYNNMKIDTEDVISKYEEQHNIPKMYMDLRKGIQSTIRSNRGSSWKGLIKKFFYIKPKSEIEEDYKNMPAMYLIYQSKLIGLMFNRIADTDKGLKDIQMTNIYMVLKWMKDYVEDIGDYKTPTTTKNVSIKGVKKIAPKGRGRKRKLPELECSKQIFSIQANGCLSENRDKHVDMYMGIFKGISEFKDIYADMQTYQSQ